MFQSKPYCGTVQITSATKIQTLDQDRFTTLWFFTIPQPAIRLSKINVHLPSSMLNMILFYSVRNGAVVNLQNPITQSFALLGHIALPGHRQYVCCGTPTSSTRIGWMCLTSRRVKVTISEPRRDGSKYPTRQSDRSYTEAGKTDKQVRSELLA